MGVSLGDRLTPSNEEVNAKGFWEDIDINLFNVELLSAVNSDWHHLAPILPRDVDQLRKQGYMTRATGLLRQKVGKNAVFGFKDPRLVKLIPFWQDVFTHCAFDVSYVLALRHPLSVVDSLTKRDTFQREKSYLLWLGHVISSLAATDGCRRVLVDYDLLMQDPDRELGRVASCLDLKIEVAELRRYKAEFLDAGLRHSHYALNDLVLDDACPRLVQEIYGALLAPSEGRTSIEDEIFDNLIAHWVEELERLKPSLVLADKLLEFGTASVRKLAERDVEMAERDKSIVALDKAVADRDSRLFGLAADWAARGLRISELDRAISDRDVQLGGLAADWAARGLRISELDRAISDRDVQIRDLAADWEARGMRISQLDAEVVERDIQLSKQSQVLSERECRIVELFDETNRRSDWALGLERELVQANNQLANMASSTSWRITLPLRELRRWLKNPVSQVQRYRGMLERRFR